MRFSLIVLFFLIFIQFSCDKKSAYGSPVIEMNSVLKDFNGFWKYRNDYLKFSDDFVGLDPSSKVIDKRKFLELLKSKKYFPLRLDSADTACYQLQRIDKWENKEICDAIVNLATIEYNYLLMEGNVLPDFDCIDIEGKVFNRETTKGKIVVLKFWFINCQQCINEMPFLNDLVKKHEKSKDIVFLSLAFDYHDDLKKFLRKKDFNYAVIANKKKYITDDLGLHYFPTHMIIDKKGRICKVVNNHNEIEQALDKEIMKYKSNED